MGFSDKDQITYLKVGQLEEISDGRMVQWLELPFGDHPFSVPVNLLPDHLEQGDYVALSADASSEELFLRQREDFTER
jgi:hypothetical protein